MLRSALLASLLSLFFGTAASADPRPFVYTNDTYAMGKGHWEYEQWVEWRTHKEDEPDYDRVDFRHEFEFGITDNFDLAVYLPSWRYVDSDDFTGTQFGSVDVEGIVYFSNPVTDAVGLGLYNEVKVGEDELEFEIKLLVQKDIGQWVFGYNLVLETAVEGVFDNDAENEVEGVLKHTVGVSYAIRPGWLIGAEGFVESSYADWSEYDTTTAYVGPNFSYQGNDHVWFTVAPVYQVTDNEGEPDWRVRAIIGVQF
jgi:hypothetical protein